MAPQIGKLLIMGYLFSCFDPILTIASVLSYRDPYEDENVFFFIYSNQEVNCIFSFVTPIDKLPEIDQIRRRFSNNTMSDHLMLINIYQAWKEQRNYHEKNQFCLENFLNSSHMKMIDKIRNQLRHLIQDYFASYTGFNYCRSLFELIHFCFLKADANRNQDNDNLICSLMCAGLYPNIARICLSSIKSSKRPCLLETKFEKRVSIHPRSINAKLRVNLLNLTYLLAECSLLTRDQCRITNYQNYPTSNFGK